MWSPPSPDPGIEAYNVQLAAAQKTDFANAVRERLQLVSAMNRRPSDDLRAEERDIVYANLLRQLMGGLDRHVTSELVREMFDVDEMLYFVAPDYWRPQLKAIKPPLLKPNYPPEPAELLQPPFPQPTDPPSPIDTSQIGNPDLTDNTVLSWYGLQDTNGNIASDGTIIEEIRNNYLITEQTQPAPKGSSLGWLIQIDADSCRNEFLNAAWVKAVLPFKPGHELDALAWLQSTNPPVEGINGLSATYELQPGDPTSWQGQSIGWVLQQLAQKIQDQNTDMNNTLATETVFEDGFDPLEGGFRATDPYQVFDQWIEVMPTDQVVAVAVQYDPKTGKQI